MATEREIIERASRVGPFTGVENLRQMVEHNSRAVNAKPPEIGAFHEDVALRPGLTADIAVPRGTGPFPSVVYFHGGGWISGSSKSHRKLGMEFAAAGFLCVNVDYRLAPEHLFPAGFDDSVFAVRWAAENVKRWNGDAARMAVGGDSAGANLAAAVAIALSKEAGPPLKAALLFYGLYDLPELREHPIIMISDEMLKAYLGSQFPAAVADPRVSPRLAVRPGAMPPALLLAGTNDPLEVETLRMAETLRQAGIPREVHVLEDMPHAFLQIWMISGCTEGLRLTMNFLNRHM